MRSISTQQYQIIVSAVNSNSDDDRVSVIDHFNSNKKQAEDLLLLIIDCWDGKKSDFTCKPPQLLSVGVAVKSIRDRVLLACVKAIHAKTICGRSATLCVAEIRIVLSNLAQSVTAFNSFSSNQSRETISSLLHVIGELCLAPLLQYKAKFDVQPFLTTLDVLSTAVLSLELIKNSFSDEYEDICIDLIDSLFFTDWHSDAVLPLANMLCELYSYVKSEHLQKLKMRLTSFGKNADENYGGLLKVCLGLFEQSCDVQWIDLLRLIYWYVPESYIQTVETILEQLLHQSSIEIAISIAAIIEDLSVEMFNNLRTNSFSYDYQTEDNHAFLNGRVIVTVADVRLIGVVMRTIFPKDGSRYSELRKPECVDSNQIIVSRAMLSAITTIVALIKSGADLVLLVNYIKDASEIIQHQCINNVHIIGPLFQLVVQLAIAQSANSSVDIINKFYKEIENVSSGSLSKLDCHNDNSERKDMFCYSYAQHSWICTARMTDMLNAFLIMSTPSSVTEKTLLSMIVEENVESVFDVLQRWFLLLFDMFPSAQKHLLEAVLDRLLNSENLMTDSEEDLNCIEDGESSGKTMNLNGKEEIALNSTTNTIFLKLLHEICSSRYNANNSDALGKTVLFSLVTLEDLPLDTNLSIQKSIVYCCVYNHDIYSSLLSINRKGLLHKSPERKFLSIKILIAILSTVKSETYQKEIMQALFYCFQLPIFLRSVFYGELVYLVSQLPSIVKTKTSERRSRIAYDNSCNLSQQTILLLQHKLREISKQLCNNLSISKQDTTSCSSSAKNEFTALFLSQFIDRSNHLPTNNEHLLSEDLYQFILLCYYVDRRIGTESYHVDLYNSAFRMFNIDSDGYCLEDISTVASSPSIQIVSAIAGSLSNCLDVCKTAVKGSKSVDASACESKYDRLLCMVIAYVAVLAIVECLLDCHSSPIISVEESNNLTKRREELKESMKGFMAVMELLQRMIVAIEQSLKNHKKIIDFYHTRLAIPTNKFVGNYFSIDRRIQKFSYASLNFLSTFVKNILVPVKEVDRADSSTIPTEDKVSAPENSRCVATQLPLSLKFGIVKMVSLKIAKFAKSTSTSGHGSRDVVLDVLHMLVGIYRNTSTIKVNEYFIQTAVDEVVDALNRVRNSKEYNKNLGNKRRIVFDSSKRKRFVYDSKFNSTRFGSSDNDSNDGSDSSDEDYAGFSLPRNSLTVQQLASKYEDNEFSIVDSATPTPQTCKLDKRTVLSSAINCVALIDGFLKSLSINHINMINLLDISISTDYLYCKDNNYVTDLLEIRSQRRLYETISSHMIANCYASRVVVLQSLIEVICAINNSKVNQYDMDARLDLCNYFSDELIRGVRNGLTFEAFKMYTELLRGLRNSKGNVEISELCRGVATNDCAKSYSSNCINDMFQRSNDIGIKLLSIFKYLTSKNQDLIRTTLDTAVTFSGIIGSVQWISLLMGNIYAGNYYEESVEELDADTVAIESSFLLPKESIFAITIEIMKTLENFTGNNSIDTELNHDVDENFSLSLFPKSSAAYATTAINESLLELKRSLNIIPPNNLLLLTVENVSHILFRIFANSGDDRQKNGKDRDEDSGRDKESDSPAMHILLSNQRFLSLYLIILNKYITQCIKECNSLYKSAILLRKTTVLMSKNKTKDEMSNNRDGFSSDEDDFIIDRNRQRSSKVCHKKALDKQHLSTSTLSKEDEDTIRLSCTTNISYTYHLLLLSVNIKDSNKKFLSLYLSLKNMIEKNVNSSGANNGSSDGQNTKKLIALSSKLELFESILIKIVAEIDKPYAKNMFDDDFHGKEILDLIYNESLSFSLNFLDITARELLKQVFITDNAGNINAKSSEDIDNEFDILLNSYRNSTLYKGKDVLSLQSKASQHISAIISSANRMSKKGNKKRIRSRNKVIDSWLQDETGDDAYADLEDFLVDE